MPECEISGKQVPKTIKVRIEGVVMNVAPEYASLGTVLGEAIQSSPKKTMPGKSASYVPPKKEAGPTYIVDPDFARKIKQAREKKGIDQETLAKLMLEKVSIVHNVESGHMRPSDALCAKFKKHLGVDLLRVAHAEETGSFKRIPDKVTLGDLMNFK